MTRRSGASLLGASLAVLSLWLCPLPARAGDAPANKEAARKATVEVLDPALKYDNGVGAPRVNGALSAGRPGQFRLLENAGADSVNEPDKWSCVSESQPPKLKQANVEALGRGMGALDAILLTIGTDASACNYNHFVANPAAPGALTSTERATDLARQWRKQIVADVTDATLRRRTGHYCNGATWTEYQRRTYNTIHYLQDAACEHHKVGNAYCTPTDDVPQWQIDDQDRFASKAQCGGWLLDKVVQTLPEKSTIKCDVEVVGTTGDLFKGSAAKPLVDYCFGRSIQTACMGLERVLWHHCDLSAYAPGTPKTLRFRPVPGLVRALDPGAGRDQGGRLLREPDRQQRLRAARVPVQDLGGGPGLRRRGAAGLQGQRLQPQPLLRSAHLPVHRGVREGRAGLLQEVPRLRPR